MRRETSNTKRRRRFTGYEDPAIQTFIRSDGVITVWLVDRETNIMRKKIGEIDIYWRKTDMKIQATGRTIEMDEIRVSIHAPEGAGNGDSILTSDYRHEGKK